MSLAENKHNVPADLAACPSLPNCVSSEAAGRTHRVSPMVLRADSAQVWAALVRVVKQIPRAKVLAQTDCYMRIECRSLVFRFVDDLEFLLLRKERRIAVRSCSRTGFWDFGVNRRRVETIRRRLRIKKAVH